MGIWRKNVWFFGLRIPFSLELIAWTTMASALAPEFHLDRYLLTLLAGVLGLVIGAHYIDITLSREKYLPYFPNMNRKAIKGVGILSMLAGVAVGVYMALLFSLWFLLFVFVGGFFALLYPTEKPRWLHSYTGFGIGWGFLPGLAAYYIQGLRIDLIGITLAVFLALTVTQMHHMAVLTNEKKYTSETVQNARFLLKLHMGAAYVLGLMLLLARLI